MAGSLARDFNYLPDGAIIYGWHLVRAGRADAAAEHFRVALARGLPMYSEGLGLLRDGLQFLSDLHPENEALKKDASRAQRLAAAANLDSELTCLSLNKSLAISIV